MYRLLISLLISAFSFCASAATGGQYDVYGYGGPIGGFYGNGTCFTQIPVVTGVEDGTELCSIYDPRTGGYSSSGECAEITGFDVPVTSPYFYSQPELMNPDVTDSTARAEWYAYFTPNNRTRGGTYRINNYLSRFYDRRYYPGVRQVQVPYYQEPQEIVIIGGGDFNGDGIADWLGYGRDCGCVNVGVGPNFDVDDPTVISPNIPGHDLFYVDPNGLGDWLGVARGRGRGNLTFSLTNVRTNQKRSLRIKGVTLSSKVAPKPIADPNGRDALIVYKRAGNSLKLQVRALNGRTKAATTLKGKDLIVGDYLDAPGEEIAVRSESGLLIYNPFSKTVVKQSGLPSGKVLDAIRYVTVK